MASVGSVPRVTLGLDEVDIIILCRKMLINSISEFSAKNCEFQNQYTKVFNIFLFII